MGWSDVRYKPASRLFGQWEGEARFYFVHSYHVVCERPELASSSAYYGHDFTASLEQENVFGVQFHPEKSHRYGMRLLRNFRNL
jgi:glutamine amidotransferase